MTDNIDKLSISFEGMAGDTFRTMLQRIAGYGVTITTQDGETFEAVLAGPDLDSEWYDAVLSYEVEDGDYMPLGWYKRIVGPARSDRVSDVSVA